MPFYFLSFRGVTGGEANGISKVRLRCSTIPSLSATTPSYIMFLVHVSHVLHVIFFYFTYKNRPVLYLRVLALYISSLLLDSRFGSDHVNVPGSSSQKVYVDMGNAFETLKRELAP